MGYTKIVYLLWSHLYGMLGKGDNRKRQAVTNEKRGQCEKRTEEERKKVKINGCCFLIFKLKSNRNDISKEKQKSCGKKQV